MGAYLSEPVTRKDSTEGESDRLKYGSSSMQGWRTGMEDAHTVRSAPLVIDPGICARVVYPGRSGAIRKLVLFSRHRCTNQLSSFRSRLSWTSKRMARPPSSASLTDTEDGK